MGLGLKSGDTLEISEHLHKAGADLVSLTEEINTTSAAGKMFFGVPAVLGEFEHNLAIERTTAALASKRAKGQRISRYPPLGYRFTGDRLEPNRTEQKAIARIHELRGQGLTVAGPGPSLLTTQNGSAESHLLLAGATYVRTYETLPPVPAGQAGGARVQRSVGPEPRTQLMRYFGNS